MCARAASGAPLWAFVEESLDEAEFLWGQWEAALTARAYDLKGVSFWVEGRLLGAIDGVCVAGDTALGALLVPALAGDDPDRATAAAHAIALEGSQRGTEALAGALRDAKPTAHGPLRRGLELTPPRISFEELEQALVGANPDAWATLLGAQAFRRLVPSSEILAAALATDHIGLQRAALQSLRHRARDAHRRDGEPEVTDAHLHASDPDVRDAAIETGLMRGLPAAWDRCTSLLAEPTPDAGNALLLAALLGPEPIQQRLASAVASPSSCRAALFALGFAGTRAAAETCLEAMALEPVAALAAEAFSGITGLDLAAEGMVIQPEPEPELAPEEEDVRPVITPNEEDLLPRPERSRVTSWWDRQRGRFVAGRRYLDGMPVSLEVLEAVLSHGSMRRRAPIALELAVRTAGRCHVDPRAFASVQRQQMTQVRQISVDSIRRAPLAGVYSQI